MENKPQLNDPNTILEYLKPFFPQDPALAVSALHKAFPELPSWLSKLLMMEMFGVLNLLQQQEILKKQEGAGPLEVTRGYIFPQDMSSPIYLN